MSEGAGPDGAEGSVTLVLVRHGESRWNAAGVLQGQRCAGLSEVGFAQAEATAELLTKVHGDTQSLVRSDIDRVAQTAAATERRLGLPAALDPRLREIDLGSWSGRPREEVHAEAADDLRAWLACEDIRPGGGERLTEMRERVWAAVTELGERLAADGGGTALLFTHGGPIRTAVAAVLGLPPGAERRLQPVRNCSLSVIRLDTDGQWRLAGYNRVDHLG